MGLTLIGQANATTFSFADFSDLSGFQLNGSTATINPGNTGALNTNGDSVLRLTNTVSQAGSAFLTDAVSLAADASFSSAFSFQFTDQQNTGADGIVFTVQTVSNTAGGLGGGIGYGGLGNSVGVEFDNWDNGPTDANSGNHAGINLNGSMASSPLSSLDAIGQLDAGAIWHAWVDYDGVTDTLEVRASLANSRPATALLSKPVDLVTVLGQTDAFIGFTSGTGYAGADHDILTWEFRNEFDPIGVPDGGSTFALFGLGLFGIAGMKRKQC